MPELLTIPRLNRRLFLLISGILWLLFLAVIFAIIKVYLPSLNGSLPAIMKFIMNLVDLKYYLLGFSMLLMVSFSYGYIGRFKDGGISPWIAALPLIVFYGIIVMFAKDLFALLQESNLLLFIAKMKKFMEVPTLANFQGLIAPKWIQFMGEKQRWIDIGIGLYFVLVVSAMVVPSQSGMNRYGAPNRISMGLQLLSILMASVFWGMTILMGYLCWQFVQLPHMAEYLGDYDRFIQLLNMWRGI